MASFIRARLFRAESVTEVGVSPRVTQVLMISSAWIGCSSSYLACSSSHHRPRGPIFSFLASPRDRKSTRLNSSHGYISYAVFCLKKKKKKKKEIHVTLYTQYIGSVKKAVPSTPNIYS